MVVVTLIIYPKKRELFLELYFFRGMKHKYRYIIDLKVYKKKAKKKKTRIPLQLSFVVFCKVANQPFWTQFQKNHQVSLGADERETKNYQLLQYLANAPQH